ncbi:MAG: glycoside hydrolase family 127 protein, partial [Lachnospiraceae bacterium]|nr:glycoside hydrolase family 127 protein [Lachnospiraceae bacterium]
HCTHPFFFGLHIRMPDWMEKTLSAEVRCTDAAGIVSCSKVEGTVDDGGWFTIRRAWRNGDELQLNLPQQLRVSCLDPVKGGPVAFTHGPVVLAADYNGPQTPCDHMNVKELLSQMYEEGDHPLHYLVRGRTDISFKPFYEFREHERYFLYHDTTAHARRNFF